MVAPARTIEKAVAGSPNLELEALDLMSPSSIDDFANRFLSSGKQLHILINTARIITTHERCKRI